MSSHRHIAEAIDILMKLGMPRAQQNERSALCLLALLNLTPGKRWIRVENPLIGITPMMDFCRDHYGKTYAPNTRETFRRQTIHQFVAAGIALHNPDAPGRAVNSPKAVYQIEPNALNLLRKFGKREWEAGLQEYLAARESLAAKYAKERKQNQISVIIDSEKSIQLSPGEHSELVKAVIDEFAPRFLPDAKLIYVGDTGNKWAYFDEGRLMEMGVLIEPHGKMPDIVVYFPKCNWLVLVEVVTSHGPVDGKRHEELACLFGVASAGLVYVTAFPNRSLMARYLSEIAWETEVWCADSPSHLIHFNGERFLGPYANGGES